MESFYRRTAHFALHGQLCVLAVALWTEVSSQRQTCPAAAVQMTRRHTMGDTHSEGNHSGVLTYCLHAVLYSRHTERRLGVLVSDRGVGVLRKS